MKFKNIFKSREEEPFSGFFPILFLGYGLGLIDCGESRGWIFVLIMIALMGLRFMAMDKSDRKRLKKK